MNGGYYENGRWIQGFDASGEFDTRMKAPEPKAEPPGAVQGGVAADLRDAIKNAIYEETTAHQSDCEDATKRIMAVLAAHLQGDPKGSAPAGRDLWMLEIHGMLDPRYWAYKKEDAEEHVASHLFGKRPKLVHLREILEPEAAQPPLSEAKGPDLPPPNSNSVAPQPSKAPARECWVQFNPKGEVWDALDRKAGPYREGYPWVRMVEAPASPAPETAPKEGGSPETGGDRA